MEPTTTTTKTHFMKNEVKRDHLFNEAISFIYVVGLNGI